MKNFINEHYKGLVSYDEEYDFVVINVSDIAMDYRFVLLFYGHELISFLNKHNIEETEGGNILYDCYVEDDEGVTKCETHSIRLSDFLQNYISDHTLHQIITIRNQEFANILNNKSNEHTETTNKEVAI
jgi:hypothetical protein